MKVTSLNGDNDNICNGGRITLELDIDSGDDVIYNQICHCTVFIDSEEIEESNQLLSLLIDNDSNDLGSINNCYLNIDGSKLIPNTIYEFKITKNIAGNVYYATHIIESILSPIISSFDKLTDNINDEIYSMDISSPIGINITLTTFDETNTIFTVYKDNNNIKSGTLNEILQKTIVIPTTNINTEKSINITICGLDNNLCHSCFSIWLIKENPITSNLENNTNSTEIINIISNQINQVSNYANNTNNIDLSFSMITYGFELLDELEEIIK